MGLSILLRCRDLEETRQFYQALPSFGLYDSAENTLTVEHQDGKLIFTVNDLWENQLGFSGTIYFMVSNLDRFFEDIREILTIAWPIQTMAYGTREFGIRDCNGYHLAFQQAGR